MDGGTVDNLSGGTQNDGDGFDISKTHETREDDEPDAMAPEVVPFTVEHFTDEYIGWLNDPEVVRYSEQRHVTHTRVSCASYIAAKRGQMWAVIHEGEHVGNITVDYDRPNQVADVSILLGKSRGQGIGAKAFETVCDRLIEGGARKVTAGCMGANKAMIHMAVKAGMRIECIRRGQFVLDGAEQPIVHMARYA